MRPGPGSDAKRQTLVSSDAWWEMFSGRGTGARAGACAPAFGRCAHTHHRFRLDRWGTPQRLDTGTPGSKLVRGWLRRRRSHQALTAWVERPRHELAADVGRDGRGLDHVQRILHESLRAEGDAVRALDHTRLTLSHLRQDRELMAQALLTARAEVRRHQPVGFDADLLTWCDG